MAELTIERLKAVLHYDPDTGIFTWLVRTSNRISAGSAAGSLMQNGYICISIDSRRYLAHRLAWFYMTGEWPNIIDHEDRTPINNRWNNLRDGGQTENMLNKSIQSNNTTGFQGVTRNGKGFMARITKRGKTTHIGSFPTAEEAHKAYQIEKMKHQPLPGS